MVSRSRAGIVLENYLPLLLVVIGGMLFVSILVEISLVTDPALDAFLSIDTLTEIATTGPFALAIAYGGRWLARSAIGRRDYPRIGYWTVGGILVFLAINVLMILVWPADVLRDNLAWARFAASAGGAGGLFIGAIEARAIHRGREVERAATRAELAGEQRDWLEFANGLLRHEVTAAAASIRKTVTHIRGSMEPDEDVDPRFDTILETTDRMTSVIEDVRVLLEATLDEPDVEPIDLTALLRAEIDTLQSAYDDVEIEVSIPGGLTVLADDLLTRVFSNLLANAVEHNYSSPPRISVTVDERPATVTVHVADNGPGIPHDKRATLFEVKRVSRSRHGLGLFLVKKLLESYGGGIRLVETGAAGSEFAVDLPRPADPVET